MNDGALAEMLAELDVELACRELGCPGANQPHEGLQASPQGLSESDGSAQF